MKKVLSILLLVCLVVCCFTACGDDEPSSSATESKAETSKDTSTDTSEETEKGEKISYADLEKRDLGGREIYIIERWFGIGKSTIDFTGEVLYMEDDNGSLTNVNQAKKDIIEQVQRDYNCKITGEIFGEGSTNIVNDLKTLITNDIATSTPKYDFFFESYYYYAGLISDGFKIYLYEPLVKEYVVNNKWHGIEVVDSIQELAEKSSLIIANRMDHKLNPYKDKVYTRDVFNRD